jgi:hypothetical protein
MVDGSSGLTGATANPSKCRPDHKEETMTQQTAQYDHSGSTYDECAQTAALKRAGRYIFFHGIFA